MVAALVSAAGAATGAPSFDSASHASACLPAPTVPGVTEGASEPGTVAAPVGMLRATLLLVQPADVPPDESTAPPHDAIEAAEHWFRSVSYGRLDYHVQTLARWLALPGRSSDYAADAGRYLADAVAAADPYVDFSEVDLVYLSPPSGARLAATSAILNGFGVQADGRDVRFWVSLPAGFAASGDPFTLVHETGHLLGLPDLYLRGSLASFHRWDVMAGRWPSELLAWHRWKLGWLDEAQIVCVTGRATRSVTLVPLERPGGTKAVFVRRGRRVLAVEARARIGYDRTLCETGVLVYEVDRTPFRKVPVRIHGAQSDRDPPSAGCGPRWNAPLAIGPGERRTLRTPELRVELLARRPDGSYRVRVSAR